MPRLLRRSSVLLAGVLAAGALSAPAQADPTAVSVSAGPGVLFADCVDHPFSYSISPPLDNLSWNIQLTVQAPDGTSAGSLYISKGDPTTGVDTEQFCGGDDIPGTYTVTGSYSLTLWPNRTGSPVTTTTAVAPFTFDMRLPGTAVTAKTPTKKVKRGKKVKVNVSVTDERPTGGYFGTDGARVYLQRQKGSRWVAVPKAKGYTKSSGKVQLRYKHTWKGKTTLRAVSTVYDLGTATSSPFTVKGR